jgi:hypothetical protein
MASPFKIYRILCSTPPELEAERCLFESSLAQFGEQVTFPEQILFAGASFRGSFDATRHRAAAESNVFMCDFFVHIFGESWPAPVFQGFINLAQQSIADPSKPMRLVTVMFRNLADADEKVRKFHTALIEGGKSNVREFHDAAELEQQLKEVYAGWYSSVVESP